MSGRLPAIQAIARDRESGAAEIARRAAEAMRSVHRDDRHEAADYLLRAQPSMAPLWRLATEMIWSPDHPKAVPRFLALLDADRDAASAAAAALPDRVLTISWSSSVLAAIVERRPRHVLCMASEPGGEGRRMAEAVAAAGAVHAVEVIPDDEALELLPADAVLVGADAVTPEAVTNKVKTRELAELARRLEVPCYAVAGETKFVGDVLPVTDPFERTPLEAFTALAVPAGMWSPAEARAHARTRPVHPDLRVLLEELGGRLPSVRARR